MDTYKSIKQNLLFGIIVTLLFMVLLESISHVVEFIAPPPSAPAGNLTIPPKQKGEYRIFIYGESTVHGDPIREFGFVSQLAFWLRDIHPEKPTEVYNFGRAGWPSAKVLQLVEETITYDPDLLIILVGHNEFLNREVERRLDNVLARFALTRVLARGWDKLQKALPLPQEIVLPNGLRRYDRGSSLFKEKVQNYLNNLQRIVEVTQRNDKSLLLLTAPSNVSDWPPVYKRITINGHEERYEQWITEVDRLLANKLVDRAIEKIHELLQMYPNDPLLLYLLARANVAAGNYEYASRLFIRAKDLDPMPWRALTEFNQAIRKLAERDRVFLVDVEKSFQRYALHGLVGFSLIADNCHPTPLGNAIIAREILAVMRQKRLFLDQDSGPSRIDIRLEHFLAKTTTAGKRQSLEMEYLLENAKYSMKTPFHNFKASRMYLDKALVMDSSNWEIWVNIATIDLFENRIEEGRQHLKIATQLRGESLDLNDRKRAPYLKESLEAATFRLEDL